MASISISKMNSPTGTRVDISGPRGGITIWFSYDSPVGFSNADGIVASENCWSTTTGKHLNEFSDKKNRMPRGEFLEKYNKALDKVMGA